MVVRIFYFVVAIFSVVMVFLVSSDPYFAEQFKPDLNASSMQMYSVTDHEINATMIVGIYEADEVNRYKNRDEFLNFKAKILRDNLSHNLSSNKAVSMGDVIRFEGEVRYENNESMHFFSQRVDYNTKNKIAVSPVPFAMMQNGDKILGKSGQYDMNKKQTQVKGLQAWIEQERR